MADLADEALDLISTSASRWHALWARGREWRDTALSTAAWKAELDRRRGEGQTPSLITNKATSPRPDQMDEPWRLWIADDWRRANFVAGGSEVDVVFHGAEWWSNGHGTSRTNGGAPNYGHGQGPGQHLVDLAGYPRLIEVTSVTAGSLLGRETLDVKATARRGYRAGEDGTHGLVIGDVDEIELSIDRERGVILRAASWFGGSPCRIMEMTEVAFDEELPVATFEIAPLPGLRWLDVGHGEQPG